MPRPIRGAAPDPAAVAAAAPALAAMAARGRGAAPQVPVAPRGMPPQGGRGAPGGGLPPEALAKLAMAKQAAQGAAPVQAFKKGGLASGHKSADGIAKRGKTRGLKIGMKKGGKC